MKPQIALFVFAAFLEGLIVSSSVCAQSVRVAVAGDPSLADLIDVTSGQLSQVTGLTVLDRSDLDRLGQEQQIQAVLSSQDFAAVRLVPADGLVLLRAVSQDGKKGVFARLVAVQPGVVLREVALPDGIDPMTGATMLQKEFAPYWAKLAAVQKGGIETLSLLGLRFEVDSPATRELERSMNLLLASRLGAEPDVMVLERWRLNDALFEKSLAPGEPSAFWTGSSLIDGSMRMDGEQIVVSLRLRPPAGTEVVIRDQDTTVNLPLLVGRLADKIQHRAMQAETWNPAAEAAHYATLGGWCLDNGLFDEGTQAIETAQALGDHSRKTQELQVVAYAREAYPDDMHGFYPNSENYRPGVVTPDSLPQRVECARMAATLARDFLKTARESPLPGENSATAAWIDSRVFYNCVRALRAAYDNRFQVDHAEAVAELRHALQQLTPELDRVLLPRPDWIASRAYLYHRIHYAGLWHETPENTLTFYRENLGPQLENTGIRAGLFDYDTFNPPFLDGPSDLAPMPPAFTGPPWIVAWDEGPDSDVEAIWQKFVTELEASPDPLLQMDGVKFEFKSSQTSAGRTAALGRFVDLVQLRADLLSGPRAQPFAAGIDGPFLWAAEQGEKAEIRQKLTSLYLNLMKQHVELPPEWFSAGERLLYNGETTDDARELLAALEDYLKWYGARPQADPRVLDSLAELRQTIFRAKTELTPASMQANALPVTRFWRSSSQMTGTLANGISRYLFVSQRTLTESENNVWFMTQDSPYRVFGVDPATLQVAATFTIPEELASRKNRGRMNIQYLDVSPQWIAASVDNRVFVCERANGQWRQLDLPPFIYKPRFVNSDLYLLYWPAYDPMTSQVTSEGTGLIRVSLPEATYEDLVSSRRIPPQTSLDGKRFGVPLDLWMTQSGLTLATWVVDSPMLFRAYATPLGKNDWSPFLSFARGSRIRLCPGGALIAPGGSSAYFQGITLAGLGGRELLLYNPNDGVKNTSGPPRWNFPADFRIRAPQYYAISPVMRGDDLCLYANPRNGLPDQASLFYFAHGQEEGVKIPLAFDVQTMKSSRSGRLEAPILNFESLQATDFGLVIYGLGDAGFWVIPWSDIDAYRAKAGLAAR
jgi:hypothetical protein